MTGFVVKIKAPNGLKYVGPLGLVQKASDAMTFESEKSARTAIKLAGIPPQLIVAVEPTPQTTGATQ